MFKLLFFIIEIAFIPIVIVYKILKFLFIFPSKLVFAILGIGKK